MSQDELFNRELIERLTRMETKQDASLEWQRAQERRTAGLMEVLDEHTAIINRGRGIFMMLHLLWAGILAWFGLSKH